MLTIEKRADGVLRIFADGQLTTDDYADFVPRFEQLARQGASPMRVELGPDFGGWSVAALWRDLKFDYAQRQQFGRIAVIGDRRWEAWGTELADPAFPGEMRFFESGRESDAEEWLLSQNRS